MKKRGISLIVLVITIIVIVILATTVIVTVVQNNPISKAKEATNVWNESMLKERLNDFEMDLAMEFQEQGLGSVILPSYAKEKYKEVLQNGGTLEEAEVAAKDSFIGDPDAWEYYESKFASVSSSINVRSTAIKYSPLYDEVKRALNIIDNSEDTNEISNVRVNENIVPSDLVSAIYGYRDLAVDYYNGSVTDDEFDTRYASLEPLYGLIQKDPNNKYYNDTQEGTLKIPYYIYLDKEKTKIAKLQDYRGHIYYNSLNFEGPTGMYTVTFDENYTSIEGGGLIPSTRKEIILPNTIRTIKKGAFVLARLDKLEIPSSVEIIEEGAIDRVTKNNLKELIIHKAEGSIPGAPWGLDTTKTNIIWNP